MDDDLLEPGSIRDDDDFDDEAPKKLTHDDEVDSLDELVDAELGLDEEEAEPEW